jgi:hypothetical protein
MQEQDETRTVDRRRLLRRAGTVAAGAAGATVVGAIAAAPAQAAPGDTLKLGTAGDLTNTSGAETTKLTGGTDVKPTLRLENAAGSALSVAPTGPNVAAPAGSIFVDQYGDFSAIGTAGSPAPYVTYAYSSTWATMTIPIYPERYLVTLNTAGRGHVVSNSATFDAAGRLVPRNVANGADLVLDLSMFLRPNPGYAALQCNVTALNAEAPGWATIWSGDVAPLGGINYQTSAAITNYVQTLVHPANATVSIKVNKKVALIVDVLGFVVTDSFAQLKTAGAPPAAARAAGTARAKSPQRQAPKFQ